MANLGVVPFKWRVAGAENLPPEFKVGMEEGLSPALTWDWVCLIDCGCFVVGRRILA